MREAAADGLRGWAALNVVFCHYVSAFFPGLLVRNFGDGIVIAQRGQNWFEALVSSPPVSLAYNGTFPVLIFFVLSGYVLVSPLRNGALATLHGRLWGRVPRLGIPIAAASLFAFLLYRFGQWPIATAAEAANSAWLAPSWDRELLPDEAIRLIFWEGLTEGDGRLLPPLWTLKVELAGSILVLALAVIVPKDWEARAFLAMAVFLWFALAGDWPWYVGFALGAYLNFAPRLSRGAAIGLALVGLYCGAYQIDHPAYSFLPEIYGRNLVAYNLIGAVLVVWAVKSGWMQDMLGGRVSQFLGEISFSLYLIHFPIMLSLGTIGYLAAGPTLLAQLVAIAVAIAVTIAVAWVFSRTVDRFGIATAKRFSTWVVARMRPKDQLQQ